MLAQRGAEIHDYAKGHQEWFQKQGFLSDGVPVDDTRARIVSKIYPEQFRQCFIDWMQAVHELTQGEVIAIDGKTLRGSYHREDGKSTIHMVCQWLKQLPKNSELELDIQLQDGPVYRRVLQIVTGIKVSQVPVKNLLSAIYHHQKAKQFKHLSGVSSLFC